MSSEFFINLARSVIENTAGRQDDFHKIETLPENQVFDLLPGADLIRSTFFGKQVHLCNICNGKSGRCSEDCRFCAQSKFYQTQIDTYPLLSHQELQKGADQLNGTPVNRYSIVTSGRGLAKKEIDHVAAAYDGMENKDLKYCASLGIIDETNLKKLAAAGVTRYHHNLETARSHFDTICTTHSYEERIQTIKLAQKAGLTICSGGIFGLGETMAQALELALELKALDVDCVPLNFLSPIPGTPMENTHELSPLKCLKIIALFRFVLPDKDILICGGREANLKLLHPLIFYAGASGFMTGNYLTTHGRQMENDLEMIRQLGFEPRPQTVT